MDFLTFQTPLVEQLYTFSITHNNNHKTSLLCSKSREAPVKTVLLSHLVLCGAFLLAEFIEHVKSVLKNKIGHVYYLTDSSIVIGSLNFFSCIKLEYNCCQNSSKNLSKSNISKECQKQTQSF